MTNSGTTNFHAHVDQCIWIPRMGDDGPTADGWLSLYGFAFTPESSTRVALSLLDSTGRETFRTSFIPVTEQRKDVASVYPKAPLRCGYEMSVPLPQVPGSAIKPVLLFRSQHGEHQYVIPRVLNGSDPGQISASLGLASGRAVRLANLLLNEAERLGRVVAKRSKPISLFLDPTFGCNLECPQCLSKMLRDQGLRRRSIRLEQVDRILGRYGETLVKATLALWGEPLLHKQFPELVSLFKAYGIACHTSTNLSLTLPDRLIDDIIASGLDEIRLSIDGATQPTYERYRVGGDLDLVLRNVTRLAEAKRRLGVTRPTLRWVFLDFPWNEQERDETARLAHETGVDHFECIRGQIHQQPPSLRLRDPADNRVAFHMGHETLTRNMRRRRRVYRHAGCDFLDHSLAINSDGTVFPCCYVVSPKDALGPWETLEPDPFNSMPLRRLRRFVRSVSSKHPDLGPSPCVNCEALRTGYVEDQLGFWTGFRMLREESAV